MTTAPDREAEITAIVSALKALEPRRLNAMQKMKNAIDGAEFNEQLRRHNSLRDEIDQLRNQLFSLINQ